MKFYECKTCGNIIIMCEDSGVVPVCCGKVMSELEPLNNDGPYESHVPVIEEDDCCIKVKVGDKTHPMSQEHYIKWIMLETDKGYYVKKLNHYDGPLAYFHVCEDEKILRAYAFCNIHSLWVKDYEK